MINRIKISDGDMLVISAGGGSWSDSSRKKLLDEVGKWLNKRGLHDVEAIMIPNSKSEETTFNVFSVNDIFEDTVLK